MFLQQIGMGSTTLTDMTLLPSIDPISSVPGMVASSSDRGQGTKPKKKAMKSLYLKFFETAPDGKTRVCKICRKSYCLTTATGNHQYLT